MSIFARNDSMAVAQAAAPSGKPNPRSAGARSAAEAAEELRMLSAPNEPNQLRRNVPAIAMGPQSNNRRPSLSMPTTPNPGRSDDLRKLTVGREIALAGDITECDFLIVEGTMDATLRSGQRMEIAQTGLFRGVANVREADIAGRFEGEIAVTGRLRIRAGAQISGRIQYGELEIEAGGQVQGEIAHIPVVPPPANDVSE